MADTLEEFVDRYVALWNVPDPVERRTAIEALWVPSGANYTPSIEAVGYDALDARVTLAYETYVGTGQYRFRLAEPPAAHHHAVRVRWEMVSTTDEAVASVGNEFLLINTDGRIVSDHQFLDP
jgi:hypothetical protein